MGDAHSTSTAAQGRGRMRASIPGVLQVAWPLGQQVWKSGSCCTVFGDTCTSTHGWGAPQGWHAGNMCIKLSTISLQANVNAICAHTADRLFYACHAWCIMATSHRQSGTHLGPLPISIFTSEYLGGMYWKNTYSQNIFHFLL